MPHFVKFHGVNVLNRQQLSPGLVDFAKILYGVQTHDNRSAVKI